MKPENLLKTCPLNGIWRVIPSSQVTEVLAAAGLQFQIFDREHGAYDYESLLADITACQLARCSPFVRVRGTDGVEVQRCLDLGAEALVFPQLTTVEDFQRAAAMMDHAPVGTRGFNPFVRGHGYGSAKEDVLKVESPLFVPIIEMLAAVENLEEILKIDRIDMVYIGSYDLSAQLGCPGRMDDPRMVEVTDRIIDICAAAKVPVGLMALSRELANTFVERGVQAIVHGVETHRILQAFEDMVI